MRYDTRVRLEFEAEGTREDLKTLLPGLGFGNFYPEYIDGDKTRRDLPAILAQVCHIRLQIIGQLDYQETTILIKMLKWIEK